MNYYYIFFRIVNTKSSYVEGDVESFDYLYNFNGYVILYRSYFIRQCSSVFIKVYCKEQWFFVWVDEVFLVLRV